jgi:hypothetical protein
MLYVEKIITILVDLNTGFLIQIIVTVPSYVIALLLY